MTDTETSPGTTIRPRTWAIAAGILVVAALVGLYVSQLIYMLVVGVLAAGVFVALSVSRARRPARPDRLARPAPPPTGNTNTVAILALVFGLLGGLIAIPLGHIALTQIKRTGDGGRGMAVAGLVLGYLVLAGLVGVGAWLAIMSATQS